MQHGNTWRDGHGRLVASPRITALDDGEVFVFGSNADGAHGGGAARYAHEHFGAVWGEGHGLHGRSYAVDTMSGPEVMREEIAALLEFAAGHPRLVFLVTELGCGIAGYQPADVAPALRGAPANVALPASFLEVLDRA